jgi:uncharacterized protein
MINSDSANSSPFHAGELAIQARLGVQDRIDKQGRQIIRDYLPEQQRQFFDRLPYVIVGTVDESGSPWASILVGNAGFLSSPDNRTLQITATPLAGDPLANILATGIDIGVLGIELHTRRRNRLNGVVTVCHVNGFEIEVKQCFGNCPQYIQARTIELADGNLVATNSVREFAILGAEEKSTISDADTFFIATAYQDTSAGAASGIDVSHRGGKPGFVRIDDDLTLTVPDFAGNHYFNTFGNLALNPRAGLLFVDFDRGDLIYLTGTAQVIWKGAEIDLYEGAERLFRFQIDRGYRVERSLPFDWSSPEFSPFLDRTGIWQDRPN